MDALNYYNILCIERSATNAEVKTAYRHQARRFHPDVSDDPDGERKFKAVAEAYRTLRRPESRAAYDLGAMPAGPVGEDPWHPQPFIFWFALFQWPGATWLWPA